MDRIIKCDGLRETAHSHFQIQQLHVKSLVNASIIIQHILLHLSYILLSKNIFKLILNHI